MQDDRRRDIWCIDIPTLAFSGGPSNPLSDFLLANSALHLKYLSPHDKSVAFASSYYLDLGLAKFNEVLPKLSEENSPLIFASSILIALHKLHSRQENQFAVRYSVPSHWFRALQGIGSITTIARSWLRKTRFAPLLLDNQCLLSPWAMKTDSFFAPLLTGVNSDPLDPEIVATYKVTVGYLNWLYDSYLAGHQSCFVQKNIIGFPAIISAKFIDLLEAHDPRSLVITAHFFALITFVDDVWWLQGVAVREILGIFPLVPEEWQWMMEWPLIRIKSDCRSATVPSFVNQ